MKNLRGNHTTLIPLAEEIVKILSKNFKDLEFAPGFITRKNVKIKQVSVFLEDEITSVLMTILMKGSKQFVRIYAGGPPSAALLSEIKKILKPFCDEKQILLKIKQLFK
jgi:hypothetical protein